MVSWVASLELDPSPGNVVREVREAYPTPDRARLRDEFPEWVLGAADLAADYRASYFGAITHSPDRLADGNVRTSPNNNLKTLAIVGSLPIEQRCRPVTP